jgi:hypothetical protein
MDPHYARTIEDEQERLGAVLRDRASLAERNLSPDALILEHGPNRIADNLIWDGDGWWIHMHLAPYGNGLLFEVVSDAAGRVVDVCGPMAERFPLLTWTSSMLVDLGEMVAAGRVAAEVVEEMTAAARRLVVEDARHRGQLEARLVRPPDPIDKLIGRPCVAGGGPRSLVVFDFDEPLPRRGDFRVEQKVLGILYRSKPVLTTGLAGSCLPAVLARLGVEVAAFCAALGPGDVATTDDGEPPRPVTLRVGTGLISQGALRGVRWIVRGRAVLPALARVLGDTAHAQALASGLCALPRGRDEAGRSLHHALVARGETSGAGGLPGRSLGEVVAADPDAWLGLD